ncbi:MAG: glycosyltransferase family 2 protein [Bdellovibrionales bacterium]|nr:glycosyltransferase family 2 protein [Bdellovibrionales bacterium]
MLINRLSEGTIENMFHGLSDNKKRQVQLMERVYFLPTFPLKDHESAQLKLVGAAPVNAKSLEDVRLSLQKAITGEYHRILFSQNVIDAEDGWRFLEMAKSQGFAVSVWVTPHYFLRLKLNQIHELRNLGIEIEVLVVAGEENSLDSVFQRLDGESLKVTFLMTKSISVEESFHKLGKSKHQVFLYFPTPVGDTHNLLDVRQIKEKIDLIQQKYTHLTIHHRPGLDVFDPRIDEGRDLEPIYGPDIQTTVPNSEVQISVIIPSYNNCLYLSVVVKHLVRQNLDPRFFEIVLVDDGSDDGTFEYFKDFANTQHDCINFKLIKFPRTQSRRMGDGQFRASVARNLGVKNSIGEIYSFLDSDILVPENYLAHLIELHKTIDVVQGRRLELVKEKSHSQTEYNKINPELDTYPVDRGFWIEFLENPKPWNEISSGWRYVCTHSLSVRADLFKKVGWFRKTFAFYGYEDSELGYRLWSAGATFARNDHHVFHLYHADTRSEFNNSHLKKLMLLANTAPIFYVNTLTTEVYDQLAYLFDDFFKLKSLLYPIFKPIRLGIRTSGHIFLATIWMALFVSRRILGSGVRVFLTPWNLLAKARRRKRFYEEMPRGIKGAILQEENWGNVEKPLGLVRYAFSDQGEGEPKDYLQEVMKAANDHYDGIVFSEGILEREDAEDILKFAKSRLPLVVVEVKQKKLYDASSRLQVEQLATQYSIHLVVDQFEDSIIPEIHRLLSFEASRLVVQLTPWIGMTGFLEALGREYWSRVHIRLLPQVGSSDRALSSQQALDQLNYIRRNCRGFDILPEPGKPASHPFSKPFKLEHASLYEVGRSLAPCVKLSVVVHHVKSNLGWENSLKHLRRLDLSPDEYEIIFVSDAIEEDSAARELAFFMNHFTQFNFKMLHVPGDVDSTLPKAKARNELALQLGAEESQGEVIAFISSDMVWKKGTGTDLLTKHKRFDFIQSQFCLVKSEQSQAEVDAWASKYLTEVGVDECIVPRYLSHSHELSEPWTIVDDYGFSFRRETYFWLGGIRSAYVGTGFAFKELGYRFFEAGGQFFLNSRLFSQYLLSPLEAMAPKNRALEFVGARMFFAENLSLEVFDWIESESRWFSKKRKHSFVSDLFEELSNWVSGFLAIFLFFIEDIEVSWRLAKTKSTDVRIKGFEKIYYAVFLPLGYKIKYFPGKLRMYGARLLFPVAYFLKYLPLRFRTMLSVPYCALKYTLPGVVRKHLARVFYPIFYFMIYQIGLRAVNFFRYRVFNFIRNKLVVPLEALMVQMRWRAYAFCRYFFVLVGHYFRTVAFYSKRESRFAVYRIYRSSIALFWWLYTVMHPVRKIYYFMRYQILKRIKKDHSRKHQVVGHE